MEELKIRCSILIALVLFCSYCYAYSDISSSHWAYSDLQQLSEQGIVTGYPDGSFQPNRQITKAEFLSLLQKSLFPNADVSYVSNKWYEGVYQYFLRENLINSYTFQPNKLEKPIKRFEAAEAFVYCFPASKEVYLEGECPEKQIFSDTIGSRERRLAEIMVETEILQGYPDGTIRWNVSVSRAEMVCMIANLLKKQEQLKHFTFRRAEMIYEDNYAITSDLQMYSELQPYQYSKDTRPVITKLNRIELVDSMEKLPQEYQAIFSKLEQDLLYYQLKKANLQGNKLIIVEFETINSSEYSVTTGADALRLEFPGREDIKIIDKFDTDEFTCIDENKRVEKVMVSPQTTHKTLAVYIVNDLSNKIRFHRDVTTMYSDTEYIHTASFQALTVYL